MNTLQDKHSGTALSPRVFFVILVSVMLAFAGMGIKLGYGEVLSFYGRYEGLYSSGVVFVIRDVLLHALPELTLIMAMLLSSFSPFLVPLSIAAISLRGFICGVAVGVAGISLETVLFAASTVAICILASLLRHFCGGTEGRAYIFRRIYSTFCVAGFAVLCEALMIFIS